MDAGYDEVEERRRWSTSTNFDSVDWLGKINVDLVDNAIKNLFDV
jgi:crossover junction endonuclease EME1